MKKFNITGTCFPDMHYMVDLTSRLEIMKQMIDDDTYFCINRGRQYGKTTTINALRDYLKEEYTVFSISFEGVSDSTFNTVEQLLANVLAAMYKRVRYKKVSNLSSASGDILKKYSNMKSVLVDDFHDVIEEIILNNEKPVVLIIDEVDQASKYDSFLTFLGILRTSYLNRNDFPAFKSVILASVYDVKNMKRKIPDSTGKLNSPWNIAVGLDTPMEFNAQEIAGMLQEYVTERGVEFDVDYVSKQIADYTGGYPSLVSRICKKLDEDHLGWNKEGILKAVKIIPYEDSNTLFDDIDKKLAQFPEMSEMFEEMLYEGVEYPYIKADEYVNIARRFGYIKMVDGKIKISNRMFETYLYELYWFRAERAKKVLIKEKGNKNQFINNGHLDIELVLEKFSQHYNDIYTEKDVKFLEAECRKMLMLYVKPIINGTGNYYIEAETRDGTRTDMVIDYLGEQFVIEMKIWRGEAYQQKGEEQLAEYLEKLHVNKGYLVTFNFNQNKLCGRTEKIVAGKKLIEFVV